MPTMIQAGLYSATMHYLQAIDATGTDDTAKVMAQMKATPINDFFTKNGHIREDGRMVHDMYLFEVKKPSESRASGISTSCSRPFPPTRRSGRSTRAVARWSSRTRQAAAFVMAGLVPAIHVLFAMQKRRGCPAQGRA